LFILFFFIRKEPKENRRCANRSPFSALCLQGGFQGTLNDLLSIDGMRFGIAKLMRERELRHVEAHSIKSRVGLERSLKAIPEATSREG
jgi:hypothetical protein